MIAIYFGGRENKCDETAILAISGSIEDDNGPNKMLPQSSGIVLEDSWSGCPKPMRSSCSSDNLDKKNRII